jgi:hypothetical protein
MTKRNFLRTRALKLPVIVTALLALSLTLFAPLVSAQETAVYLEQDIEDWLTDKIEETTVEMTVGPQVNLATDHLMVIKSLTIRAHGIDIGVNELRFNFADYPTVRVEVTLQVLGGKPKLTGDMTVVYDAVEHKMRAGTVDNIVFLTEDNYALQLTEGERQKIVDVLNQVIDSAGGLPITSTGGDLDSIDVVGGDPGELVVNWSGGGSSSYDEDTLETKLEEMVLDLAGDVENYLQTGAGSSWEVDVSIDSTFDVYAQFTAFDTTAVLDVPITITTLNATTSGATVSIGSKTLTFMGDGDIGCSYRIPSLTMNDFGLESGSTELQDFVALIEPALLDAIEQASDKLVASTGLQFPFDFVSMIVVEPGQVVFHKADTVAVDCPLAVGWNLVSIPVMPVDDTMGAVFPEAVTVYTWDGDSYLRVAADGDVTTVEPGRGYWVRMDVADPDFTFHGTPLPADQELALTVGWNMVGVASTTAVGDLEIVEENTGQLLIDYVYWWDPSGMTYGTPVPELVPGKGYWLACTEACTLIIS